MDLMTQMQNNPVANWWKTALKLQVNQMDILTEELSKLEAKGQEQTVNAIDEMARTTKAALETSRDLQSAWRRMTKLALNDVSAG